MINTNKTILAATVLVMTVLAPQTVCAQSSAQAGHETAPVSAGNASLTSAQPGSDADADADLADRVRRSVVADRNLSSYAAKITIVASRGNVHLSGLVQNEGEKAQIAAKAAAIAGQRHIVNELGVMLNVADGTGLRNLLERASEPRAAVIAAN